MSLNEREIDQLRVSLQDAVIKCSERCLYQSAKWHAHVPTILQGPELTIYIRAAELLNSLPEPSETTPFEPEDSQMTEMPISTTTPIFPSVNIDPEEAHLESRELSKYLLAKSFFDCREFDRCAAVFLPDTILSGLLASASPNGKVASTPQAKGKDTGSSSQHATPLQPTQLPRLSQKSLFLALYAKYMAGEKRKEEDSEMVMGPHDGGNTVNKQLGMINRLLERWFADRTSADSNETVGSQGWLEYLSVVHALPTQKCRLTYLDMA